MLLNYRYTMDLEFSQPVTDQHFSIMCVPRDTERQRLLENRITVEAVLADGTVQSAAAKAAIDGLGNPYVYGVIHEPHSSFCLISEGTVETGARQESSGGDAETGARQEGSEVYALEGDSEGSGSSSLHEEFEDPASIELVRYAVESSLTAAGPALSALYSEWQKSAPEDAYGKMLHYGNCVQAALSYESGVTDVGTTAEQAVALGRGVCQDYAHVMIALLRMAGIPARYVTGMMQGEGESHAWVEANCLGYWYGIDPTNNVLVNENYIKFAHGRDYGDCMISRGIFTNPYAEQKTAAGVTVQQVPQ